MRFKLKKRTNFLAIRYTSDGRVQNKGFGNLNRD